MFCPKCKSEYREGFDICTDCNILLVDKLEEKTLDKEASVEKHEVPQELSNLVQVYSAYGQEAHLIKSLLEGDGLHPILYDEHTIQWQPLFSLAVGGIKIMVPEKEVERAKELIETFHNN